jgi:hypothetical protein
MRRPLPLLVALALTLALPAGCRSHRASGRADPVFHAYAPRYILLGKSDFQVDLETSDVYLLPSAQRKILRYFRMEKGGAVLIGRDD